jgi:hypothetical protein
MGAYMRCATRCQHVDQTRHRVEVEWVLDAIAGAIVTGKLPPDDACAWARIAAGEAKILEGLSSIAPEDFASRAA